MYRNKMVTDMVIHLLNQAKAAMLEDGWTCAYRGQDGLMCAVGCVIPDENYDEEFDADPDINYDLMSAIDSSYRTDPTNEDDRQFLLKCQELLHDNYDSFEGDDFRRGVLSGLEELKEYYPKLRPDMKRIRAEGQMPQSAA